MCKTCKVWTRIFQLFVATVLTARKTVVVTSFGVLPHTKNQHPHRRSIGFRSRLGSSVKGAAGENTHSGSKKRRNRNRKQKRRRPKNGKTLDQDDDDFHDGIEVWRIYGLSVHPDDLHKDYSLDTTEATPSKANKQTIDEGKIPMALEKVLRKKLNLDKVPIDARVVRRSLDARKKLDHPVYSYVVDIPIEGSLRSSLRWKARSGQLEKMKHPSDGTATTTTTTTNDSGTETDQSSGDGPEKTDVVVVGMGPAGLFCALQLARNSGGTIRPILLDRGKDVDKRGQDIGKIIHRRQMNEESNYAFGEGGAGTWSDGKLTTRIGRNSATVRLVLETLVELGAPSNILYRGAPHLGTDNLQKLLRNLRRELHDLGGEIHFDTKMTDLKLDDDGDRNGTGRVRGVHAEDTDGNRKYYEGDAVVLATGHSARDVYESLHEADVALEPKGFAVGFRIEHPQAIINRIQYGDEWGPCVQTGRRLTDQINAEFFDMTTTTEEGDDDDGSSSTSSSSTTKHVAKMPVPSYRLATDKADDGTEGDLRGVYSFCMCPGGQIVAASTEPDEVCVNGMSYSRRDSVWANSALVVTVAPDDPILEPYRATHGVLAGLEFQRDMERKASVLGGGNLTVPVQRMTDFCTGTVSTTVPSSSYRLGVKSAPCHEIYPTPITTALKDALANHFPNKMPGYYHEDGLLHAVETRTSSPLRVARDPDTLLAIGTENLYPSGEGAGYAGGIVSAAVDGINVAETILDRVCGESRPNRIQQTSKSVGFSY